MGPVMNVAAPPPEEVAQGSGAAPGSRLFALRDRYRDAPAEALLEAMIGREFPGEIAVVSAFGAESVVLLHMVARIDPKTPIIFLDTGNLFGETLRYRDSLQDVLGLRDIRAIHPSKEDERRLDPGRDLWQRDPDACCHYRKVLPLKRALAPFAAEVSGRKRFQTRARAAMDTIEKSEGRIKINPLADWSLEDLGAYVHRHELPRHPLVAEGYLSIGCVPCTERIVNPSDYRAGRWSGTNKDECGIHEPRHVGGEGI
jgi:phosphoadenosine phosphosulfate reductase